MENPFYLEVATRYHEMVFFSGILDAFLIIFCIFQVFLRFFVMEKSNLAKWLVFFLLLHSR
jgi:hypothetical protein